VSFLSRLARFDKTADPGGTPPDDGVDVAAPAAAKEPAPAPGGATVSVDEGPDALKRPDLEELRLRMRQVLGKTVEKKLPPRRPIEDTSDLPFVRQERGSGVLYTKAVRSGPSARMGSVDLAPARTAWSEGLALLALDPTLAGLDPSKALFVDTETTGLAGGAGTVPFLLGLAYWEGNGLVTEQLLLRNFGEESPMLEYLAERVSAASMLVSFNGKSFDWPLLRSRFVLARQAVPQAPPHLDLLHVARRIHRHRGIDCRLGTLERHVLGFERIDDLPSADVSASYMHFLRTGATDSVMRIVEHNFHDVWAMVALVAVYGAPIETSPLPAGDLTRMAEAAHRAKNHEVADCYAERAISSGAGFEGFAARARIAQARGDVTRAIRDFETALSEVDDPSVRLSLAKLYEHRANDPHRALALVLDGVPAESGDAKERRVTRLRRKIERRTEASLDLFGGVAPAPVSGGDSRRVKRRR
jgi:uncharacterized protein YprB with RNaseH-like and TPR domain